MVGDHVTYLDCINCRTISECVQQARDNSFPEHNRNHIKEGIISEISDYHFITKDRTGRYQLNGIIHINRKVVAEDKVQKVPDNIISLEF